MPLIEVAWADGELDTKERAAVLKSASSHGLREDHAAYGLLASWLEAKPGPELKAAWFEYIAALLEQLPPAGRPAFKHALVGGAEDVAKATGGFLGLGNKISKAEQSMLDELSGAFPD